MAFRLVTSLPLGSTTTQIEGAMPVYNYDCGECGTFTAMRPMTEYRSPCTCPTCGYSALRASLSAPSLAGMDSASRNPIASSRHGTTVVHPAGCGCCVRRMPFPSALSANGGRIFSSNGPPARNG